MNTTLEAHGQRYVHHLLLVAFAYYVESTRWGGISESQLTN